MAGWDYVGEKCERCECATLSYCGGRSGVRFSARVSARVYYSYERGDSGLLPYKPAVIARAAH